MNLKNYFNKKALFILQLSLALVFLLPVKIVVAETFVPACKTNDFYDKQPAVSLKKNPIIITGEIAKHYIIASLSELPKRSVVVKETKIDNGEETFIGAYKYTGYALYDILNKVEIKKIDESFTSPADLYVEIENADGEKAVLTWGEIYYPASRFQNIIATRVTPVIPLRHPEIKWPIPKKMRLVVATDLITARNISAPVRIIIHSLKAKPLNSVNQSKFSPEVIIADERGMIGKVIDFPSYLPEYSYRTVFYGRGKGIHGAKTFAGIPLQNVLGKYFPIREENLRCGLFSIFAADGYRTAYSFSEIFNNNTHANVLFIDASGDPEAGKFMLFPSMDYFSDRAVKSVSEILFSII